MKRKREQDGSFSKLKDGRIRLRISNGNKLVVDPKTGEQKKVRDTKDFYGHSEDEAYEKYELWKEEERKQHGDGYGERLFMECIYEWIHMTKELTLKPDSLSRLYEVTDGYVNPAFSIYKVNEITPEIIQTRLINKMKNDGMSYSTIKKSVNVLTGYYRWAMGMNKVTYNPTIALTMPNQKRLAEEQGRDLKVKYYTPDEIKKMRNALDETDKYCREVGNYRFPRAHVYMFIMYTGLRLGEMLALQWSDYDEKKGTITINKNIVEYKDPETRKIVTRMQLSPKTASSVRTLALNQSAKDELKIIKERSFNPDNPFIVANKNRKGNKQYVAPSNMRNALKRFCDYAGVECKGFHALRHTFASLMFAQGIEVKYISEWLGHSSVQITYDTYIHIMKECGYEKHTAIPEIRLEETEGE